MTARREANTDTKRFFEHYATDFDALYGAHQGWLQKLINRLFRRSMRLRFELTIRHAHPTEDKSVLDIGCGPGHFGIELARRGAAEVLGIDFSPEMIRLATEKAAKLGLNEICRFEGKDFFELDVSKQYDYVIVMGFMDYMPESHAVVQKALALTRQSCFFSFPSSKGILALQRKLRYKKRCPLYLYSVQDIKALFDAAPQFDYQIQKIDRDFWVQANRIARPDR